MLSHGSATAPAPGRDNVELRILDLWRVLLERDDIGVHDDFFDVGGHSLLAMRVAVGIRRVFGVELSPGDLLHAATVAQLARLVRAGGASATGSLVTLQSGDGGAPVYALPPVSGTVLLYPRVARAVGRDVPFHALQSVGLLPGEEPLKTVPEIAGCFVEQMRAVHPEGRPWHLVGYSMGDILAFEAARQLRAAGEEVGLVGLFDTRTVVEPSGDPDFALRALLWRGLRIEADVDWLRSLDPNERARVLVERAVEAGTVPADFDAERLRRMIDMYGHNLDALLAHELRPYPDEVVVFRVTDRALETEQLPEDLGWGAYATHAHVHLVPGDHFTMVEPGNVEHLGTAVREWIGRAPR